MRGIFKRQKIRQREEQPVVRSALVFLIFALLASLPGLDVLWRWSGGSRGLARFAGWRIRRLVVVLAVGGRCTRENEN